LWDVLSVGCWQGFKFKELFVWICFPLVWTMAVGRRSAAVPGGAGDDEGEDSVAALLGKNLIAAKRARRRTMAMGSVYYGGCGVVVVFFVGWRREPECDKLWKDRFFRSSGSVPT
jgi:hypothetical protein